MHESWKKTLKDLFDKHIKSDEDKYAAYKGNRTPARKDTFNAFNFDKDKLRVVILGQDPYPNSTAIGVAFATNGTLTPSLRIIKKDLESKGYSLTDYTLSSWTEQGVLLLNTALTCPYKSGGHIELWKDFTEELISSMPEDVVYLLWGKHAQGYKKFIKSSHIIESIHPVAEVYGSKTRFNGGFIEANEILGDRAINWNSDIPECAELEEQQDED